MSRQTIAVIAGAVVLFVVALVGSLAFTGGDSSGGNVHTMPSGQTMAGDTSDMHTTQDGQAMTGKTHSSP